VEKVSYIPPKESQRIGGFQTNKGDYYEFNNRDFKTSEEAIRACIWTRVDLSLVFSWMRHSFFVERILLLNNNPAQRELG